VPSSETVMNKGGAFLIPDKFLQESVFHSHRRGLALCV